MHKTICFEIDRKSLMLDKELITFTIPIFFICCDDDNQKYAVLCTDSDQLNYIVGEVDAQSILDMLNNTLSLRAFFLAATEKWRILAGDDYTRDIIEKIETLHDDELPKNDTYFDFSNIKIEEYKKQLECEIENNISSTEINTVCFQYTIPPIRFAVKINNIEPTESVQDTECVIISHVQMVPVKAIT